MKSKIKQYQLLIIISAVVFVLAGAVLATLGFNSAIWDKNSSDDKNAALGKGQKSALKSNKEPDCYVTIAAVGDNIPHRSFTESQKQLDGSYDFNSVFDGVRSDIENADIAVINQETVLSENSKDATFNTPYEIGDAIYNAGFDVVLQATDHALCAGIAGIEDNIRFWEKYPDVAVLGIHLSKEDQENVSIIEKNGIKIALLNYTCAVEDSADLKKNPYAVDVLDEKKIKSDVEKAKEAADVVIVFPNWGTEYSHKKDSTQDKWVNIFYQSGVDIVIGSRPHVIQPVEWVTSGESSHRMLVYYSLGNFISGQTSADRMLGAMAKITVKKSNSGIEITSATALPIVTHYDTDIRNYGVYKLANYTDELASQHYINGLKEGSLNPEQLNETATEILGDFME